MSNWNMKEGSVWQQDDGSGDISPENLPDYCEWLENRIAELEALVDELVNIGDNLFDSLNPIAWKHEWLDKWWKLSNCRRGEREE